MVRTFEELFLQGQRALAEGDATTAYAYWQQCMHPAPQSIPDYKRLANAFRTIGRLTEANTLIAQALQHAPQQPDLMADQASLHLEAGKADDAVELFRHLSQQSLKHGHLEQGLILLSNALMCMEYSASIPAREKIQTAKIWGNHAVKWAKKLALQHQLPAWTPKPNSAEPLRIGFISGDLCDHPVGFLLLPLLQHCPKNRWQPFIYDNGSRIDNTHRQLKASVPTDYWRTIENCGDADAIRIVLTDQLDILIDLSGHTGRTRLRLLAHRLAGVQLSWLGYSGTTGLPTVDGIILDDVLGKGTADQFAETIYSIAPSRFCFRPPFSPPLQAPPSIENGYITFGSFNNTAKYNPGLLATWANLLKQLPKSRLILKWKTFVDPCFCDKIYQEFVQQGINPERITLRGFSTHRAMLDEYNDIDIALDTFPFNGGFTSLEALWMGVPLITLHGNSPIARQSASFLKALGLTAWIADNTHAYTQAATTLASNPTHLTTYRENLRFQIMCSALYDAPAFAAAFSSLSEQLVGDNKRM